MLTLLLAILYLTFISLGLPDSVLGSAWPSMHEEIGANISYAGIISAIIAAGTIFSSLMSDRITKRFGASKTTAISTLITALALLGFGLSSSFWHLCVLAIPYGLGAGSVDAALNNYVSLHFESKHMSWLHCMWGIGAAVGPTIMGYALTSSLGWHKGYIIISAIQVVICVIIFASMPLWKKPMKEQDEQKESLPPIKLKEILSIKGAKAIMVTFFCYCALEATAILWASTYFNEVRGIDADTSAFWGSLYLLGITLGRAISGFISMKLNDIQMTRLGEGIMLLGLVMLFAPINAVSFVGIIVFGLGSAPVYPCIIHSTPVRFGADKSQAMIGVQMASAYTGTCLMPPLFGLIAEHISASLFPVYIGILTIAMIALFEVMLRKTAK